MSSRQNVASWLGADPALRELALRIGSLVELQAMLSASYPDCPVDVLSLDEGTLAVAARNAAEASRLRQREPSVVATLRRRGAAVERLRIRTRRNLEPPSQAMSLEPRAPIPASALDALDQLGARMEPGKLTDAISRLIAKRRAPD